MSLEKGNLDRDREGRWPFEDGSRAWGYSATHQKIPGSIWSQRAKKGFSSRGFRESMALPNTSMSDFYPVELWKNTFLLFEAIPVCGTGYGSARKEYTWLINTSRKCLSHPCLLYSASVLWQTAVPTIKGIFMSEFINLTRKRFWFSIKKLVYVLC